MSSYTDLFNLTGFTGQDVTVDTLTVNTTATIKGTLNLTTINDALKADASGNVTGIGLTNSRFPYRDSTGTLSAYGFFGNNGLSITESKNNIVIDMGQDLHPNADVSFDRVRVSNPAITLNSIATLNGTGYINGQALNDGQLLIGSTGVLPVAATLTGTTNQVNVASAAGSITLSLPQSIDSSSSPSFAGLTLRDVADGTSATLSISGWTLSHNITIPDPAQNANIVLDQGINNLSGTYNFSTTPNFFSQLSMRPGIAGTHTVNIAAVTPAANRVYSIQDAGSNCDFVLTAGAQTLAGVKTFSSAPIITGLTASSALRLNSAQTLESVTLTNGQLLIGSTGNAPQAASITGTTNQVNVAAGAGSITLSLPQSIDATASPTFTGATLSGLTASELVATTAGKALQSVTLANSNGCNLSFAGSTLTASMTQDLSTTATPTFGGLLNGILMYTTGTITQSGTTITGTGTTFTSAMVGGLFVPAKGQATVIHTFTSATQLTAYLSQTVASGAYTIYYSILSNGFGLSPNGHLYLRTSGASSTTTTGMTLHLVPNGPSASYAIDVSTYNTPFTTPCNGRMTFTDDNFGADFAYWAKIQGADTNALQKLFQVGANKTVTTYNNTLDTTTTGNANFLGTVTTAGVVLPTTGGTATTLAYYEEYDFVTTFGGPITTTANVTCKITRVGRQVTIVVPNGASGVGNNTSSYINANTNIPTRFCPFTPIGGYCLIQQNSVAVHGAYLINTGGLIEFGPNFGGAFTANTGNNGLTNGFTATWSV